MRKLILVLIVSLLSVNAKADQVLAYHEGDKFPIAINIQGDLAETPASPPTYVTIKKSFWMKSTPTGTELSFDGVNYQPYQNLLNNTLTVQPVGQDPAGIAVSLTSVLK